MALGWGGAYLSAGPSVPAQPPQRAGGLWSGSRSRAGRMQRNRGCTGANTTIHKSAAGPVNINPIRYTGTIGRRDSPAATRVHP